MKKKQPTAGDDAKQLTSEMEEDKQSEEQSEEQGDAEHKGNAGAQKSKTAQKNARDGQSTNKSSSVQAGFDDRRVHLK